MGMPKYKSRVTSFAAKEVKEKLCENNQLFPKVIPKIGVL